jgi:putative membrane protein
MDVIHPRYALPNMLRLLTRWFCLAAALLFIAHVYSGVTVTSFGAALWAAVVIGALNTIVRPLLVLLTLPVTLLTLGLFLFVINAAMFYGAAQLLDGLNVAGFGAALVASLIYSLCSMVIEAALSQVFAQREK